MSRKSLSNTIYLECLAFTLTALLAASDVEGSDGGTSRVARSAFDSVCYNNKQQKVKCSKKKGIIIGIIIASIFVLLGALYLYGKWAERRKRTSNKEESEPLRRDAGTVPDCEKGLPKPSKSKNKDGEDFEIPLSPDLDRSDGTSFSETGSTATGSHHRPLGHN